MALPPVLLVILGIVAFIVGAGLVVALLVPVVKGVIWLFKQVFRFIFGEIADVLRFVGAIVTAIFMVPLIIANVVLGRWSASAHYGKALQSEVVNLGTCLYRIAIGHPAKLLCLTPLTEGIERRLPQAVAQAPGADRPAKRAGKFDGYTIVGSLPGGGSGAKLYIAEPDEQKRAIFARAGRAAVRQVVIKSFSLADGSSLPQIVRESRSLEAARRLGLVLDHELTPDRFYYVTEYRAGQSLGLVTPQLHAASGPSGLDDRRMLTAVTYVCDLLNTLDGYHRGGLWHKDVKPDNIIVDGQHAHLVDFGLVTPLASNMTLTTHGTEYFRDPELVRMALRGAKVSDVDGARFDVYAAGAVLFSIIENSFPAHGVLSQVTKRCPETLRWVIRRAMTDYDKRYPTAAAMLQDLRVIANAADPFQLKPIDLPSMQSPGFAPPPPVERPAEAFTPAAAAFTPPPIPTPHAPQAYSGPGPGAGQPYPPRVPRSGSIRLVNWWTGRFEVQSGAPGPGPSPYAAPPVGEYAAGAPRYPGADARVRPEDRLPAHEQLTRARERARAAVERARGRIDARIGGRTGSGSLVAGIVIGGRSAERRAAGPRTMPKFSSEPNAGVFLALFIFLGIFALVVVGVMSYRKGPSISVQQVGPLGGPATHAAISAPLWIGRAGENKGIITIMDRSDEVDGSGNRVFLWLDVPRPLDANFTTRMGYLIQALSIRQFDVVGDVPNVDPGKAEASGLTGDLATLVAMTAGLPADSPEASEAAAKWLESSGKADLLVRVFPATGEKDTQAFRIALIPAPDTDPDVWSDWSTHLLPAIAR